jgi:Protein of unknown function (DUF1643).
MVFVNINPQRSTDPRLVRVPPPNVIEHNQMFIGHHARRAAMVICAWGVSANQELVSMTKRFLRGIAPDKLYILQQTDDGTPKHPLYLHSRTAPKLWIPA